MFAGTNNGHLCRKGAQRVFLKMLLGTVAAATVYGVAFTNQIYGASVNQGVVKVNSGNVRQSASTTANVVFCVKSEDTVAILGEEKDSSGAIWYKVASGESLGYVRSDLITKTDKKIDVKDELVSSNKTQATDGKKNTDSNNDDNKKKEKEETNTVTANDSVGVINASYVRMRSGASTTSQMVCYLDKGAIVTISGEGKSGDGEVWFQVKTGNETGFVRSDFVNKVNNEATTKEPEPGKQEEPSEEGNKEENGETDNQETAPVNDEDIVAGNGTVIGTVVRVRDCASTAGRVLSVASQGENLPVLETVNGDGRKWLRVKITSDGEIKDGYIAADYVQIIEEPKLKEQTEEVTEPDNTQENVVSETTMDNTASVKGVGVRVRQTPVEGNVLCQLSSGHPLVINDSVDDADGNKWYQVSFSYQGNAKTGYIREDFVTLTTSFEEDAPIGDEEFESSIANLPEGYKNSLRALHANHPKWRFNVIDTGLEWADALKAESAVGKNLVSKNSVASWKSTAAQAYNWSNNTWYTFDGGSWASASPELIAYYMDPRNFLNESGIYQFETFEYVESQKRENVAKMLTGTFMSSGFTDTDGTNAEYADVFVNIGQLTGVSPYLLAGRCIQEQGIFGKSQSIAGNIPGYEGIFNYFNVGAYAYSGRSATINGLIYARGNDEENLRPWNSRIKSIYGGAKYIADKFISKGQDTLYFQKFNVVNSENTLYSHQYMSNIQAASSESARIQLAYLGDDEELTFKIPYYRNMPATNCVKPTSDSSPNTYLASLNVEGYELLPAFSGATENYVVNVDSSVEYVTISAKAVSASSSVGGTGTYQVAPGSNKYTIACKSQNGSVKLYTITVQK